MKCFQSSVNWLSTSPNTLNCQVWRSILGVPPKVNTGNLFVTCWPGGATTSAVFCLAPMILWDLLDILLAFRGSQERDYDVSVGVFVP